MRGPVDYAPLLAELGLTAADASHVLAAAAGSHARLAELRRALVGAVPPGCAAFALGSLGRHESSALSDLDLAVVYRRGAIAPVDADGAREALAAALRARGLDVPDKTFHSAVVLDDLLGDIGGRDDSNDHLTYRALLLTEGAWLANAGDAAAIVEQVFGAYTAGAITRGRYLTSLSNDLHRYYRTICVDYRFKVENAGKHWAIRYFKLRHSRKLWHLANLAVFCRAALLPDEARDGWLAEQLPRPPLLRIADALRPLDGLPLCAGLVTAYDAFLAALAEPDTRRALDLLAYDVRDASPVYRRLRAGAERFDEAATAVVGHLWQRSPDHLVRYGLL
ncbi:DUF294 nucleotidyltransferase-like domain-containing protein [Nannocystis bainbridge]|uniref:DUF294 nucleotidyltransferase-like domain-containing protein n=1 Tax=Nannocystis bainbridge TaxID=2995303 RepID=A0ABT5EAT0_9BACT|nr:DUF294 nucleotidyltransferase-like domain-containing protein [Nannocystis bainbridge]MDC0722952.1 DUF294 nucleotidyltransferase-like domain-containing protein [Nannocystis bainbridge]